MVDIPDPCPLLTADHTLWAIRTNATRLCSDANTLCNAIDRLCELPEFDTEAEHALSNAITALSFALSAADEKRTVLLGKRNPVDLKALLEVE